VQAGKGAGRYLEEKVRELWRRREKASDILLELLNGPVGTLVDGLLGTGKVEGLDTADGL
jgi:hypothetical protein